MIYGILVHWWPICFSALRLSVKCCGHFRVRFWVPVAYLCHSEAIFSRKTKVFPSISCEISRWRSNWNKISSFFESHMATDISQQWFNSAISADSKETTLFSSCCSGWIWMERVLHRNRLICLIELLHAPALDSMRIIRNAVQKQQPNSSNSSTILSMQITNMCYTCIAALVLGAGTEIQACSPAHWHAHAPKCMRSRVALLLVACRDNAWRRHKQRRTATVNRHRWRWGQGERGAEIVGNSIWWSKIAERFSVLEHGTFARIQFTGRFTFTLRLSAPVAGPSQSAHRPLCAKSWVVWVCLQQ